MSESFIDLASVYRTMDTISLQHDKNLGVPTEIRVFGAEISADVAVLGDEEVVRLALDIDADAQQAHEKDQTLGHIFNDWRSHPLVAYNDDPDRAEAWALTQLRIHLVSKLYDSQYAGRFPQRAFEGYKKHDDFQQGQVVAYLTIAQFLANPY